MLQAPAETTRLNLAALPGRADAERALDAALGSGNPGWLATVVADRVHLIYERFGYAPGDAVLEDVAGYLSALPESARVYRWTATSFIVLAARRPVIVLPASIEATCTMLPLASVQSSGELIARLDHDVALRVAAARAARLRARR
jgi:GGDEF domain-containing protein